MDAGDTIHQKQRNMPFMAHLHVSQIPFSSRVSANVFTMSQEQCEKYFLAAYFSRLPSSQLNHLALAQAFESLLKWMDAADADAALSASAQVRWGQMRASHQIIAAYAILFMAYF
jgi:hypothetical protein